MNFAMNTAEKVNFEVLVLISATDNLTGCAGVSNKVYEEKLLKNQL